ncbi:hypothetical protein NC652_006874 [Populus alba x Populus x berolinensis]|nr:hypothetical protein NC652_006874 [Populus alba x Populus x berolinensis]
MESNKGSTLLSSRTQSSSGMARPVFVGNFEHETRQSDLERLFSKYGKVERELLLRKFELLSGLANTCSSLETLLLVCSPSPSTHRWNHPVFSSLDHLSLTHLTALTLHFTRMVVMISVNLLCLVRHY